MYQMATSALRVFQISPKSSHIGKFEKKRKWLRKVEENGGKTHKIMMKMAGKRL